MDYLARTTIIASTILVAACASRAPTLPAIEPDQPETPDPIVSQPTAESMLVCDIEPALEWMQSQNIIYTQSPSDEWRDCSGNFLRLSSRIASMCSNVSMAAPAGVSKYIPGGDNKRPGLAEARTTRGLARWYDDKGLFVPVYYDDQDTYAAPPVLAEFRNKIQTGTVFWFSKEVPRSEQGIEHLYREGSGTRGIIGHMGTVVDVTRDDDTGDVIGWTMYHGQNPRVHNELTTHKWEKSGVRRPIPQGGYDIQRIVGFAPHLVPELATAN